MHRKAGTKAVNVKNKQNEAKSHCKSGREAAKKLLIMGEDTDEVTVEEQTRKTWQATMTSVG